MSFNSIVHKILNEGKKESEALLAKTFPYNNQIQQKILALDQTPSKGDVPAIIKFYNETKDLSIITNYFNLYFKLKSKNVPVKAPSTFKTFIEFTEHVDATETKQKLKNAPEVKTIEHEDNEDKLVDTDELTIYKGDSRNKCIKYGEGYSFCISRRIGGNMYDSYRLEKNSTFYFIFFKKIPKTNPDHILVLDHTKHGWEWTNQLNDTVETTWAKIITKFPVLAQYENLFVKNPLSDEEKKKIKFTTNFRDRPSLKKFLAADRDLQLIVLKTGVTIIDEVFSYLMNNNLWQEYINEYVSVGPNLTPLQADAIEAKGGAILKQYLKSREIAIPQLEQGGSSLKINKLDKNIPYVQYRAEQDYVAAGRMVESGRYNFNALTFLQKLPDNIPESINGNFNCFNTQLTSLEGSPKSVGGDFYCYNNNLTSLKGSPTSVRGDFFCYNNQLTSLEGSPENVRGDFHCANNHLTSLEGAPQRVGGFNCCNNKLVSLKGIPMHISADFYCAGNPVKFNINDIKAAMAESRRKLEKQNESVISNQFNEGYKEVLTAILGIGAAGLFYDANRIEQELAKRPESKEEKITAIKQADKKIKSSKFHKVANDLITKLTDVTGKVKQITQPPLKLIDNDPAVYNRAVELILPSEILGTNIYSQINNKFMKPYRDDVKKWTIGVGHLIGKGTDADRKAYIKARQRAGLSPTLSRKEALELFHKDVSIRVPIVKAKFAKQWDLMSTNLKAALVDIAFRGDLFKPNSKDDFNWVKALKEGKYKEAAEMYLNHKEYKKRKNEKGANDGVVKRMNRNAEIIRKELVPASKKEPLL